MGLPEGESGSRDCFSADIFVLAGGLGSRLKNSSLRELQLKSKLMVEIDTGEGSKPMISHILENVIDRKFVASVTVLTMNHPASDPEAVENYAYSLFLQANTPLHIVREPRQMGTAGAVFNGLSVLRIENSLVISPGDVLYPFDTLYDLIEVHKTLNANITWAVTSEPGRDAQNPGRLAVDPETKRLIKSFEIALDEPIDIRPADSIDLRTSVGVMIVEPLFYFETFREFQEYDEGPTPDLYRVYIPWLLQQNIPVHTYDIKAQSPDLGTPDRLEAFGRKMEVSSIVD